MRNDLPEWYPLSPEDGGLLVAEATIVFDTNALLTLYRMSVSDRNRLLDLMSELRDRLWIPFWVAEEFQRSRLGVYQEQLSAYDELEQLILKLKNQLASMQTHPVLTLSEIKDEVSDRLNSLVRYLSEQRAEKHPDDLADPGTMDGIRDALDDIFDGRVGARSEISPPILAEAKKRFEAKTPPGYKDAAKPPPRCYGDYFLWRETLTYMRDREAGPGPLLFVTEERKEDWWLLSADKNIIAPRPELLHEAHTYGIAPVWLVSLRRFFETQAKHLGWNEIELGDFASVGERRDAVEAPGSAIPSLDDIEASESSEDGGF